MLDEYTCAMGRTYLLDTCDGQIARGYTYMLIAYTCGGLIAKGHTCTLIA